MFRVKIRVMYDNGKVESYKTSRVKFKDAKEMKLEAIRRISDVMRDERGTFRIERRIVISVSKVSSVKASIVL